MQVEIIFTRGDKLGAKVLSWLLGNRFTHVAISDGTSTVEAEAGKGVFRQSKEKLLHTSEDAVCITVNDGADLWWYAQQQVDSGYDYWGAFAAWVRIPGIQSEYLWYCSELVNQAWSWAFSEQLCPDEQGRVRPDDLYNQLMLRGYILRGGYGG